MKKGIYKKKNIQRLLVGKIFMRQGILWGIFHATGYRVQGGFLHISITSLVKYPPPPAETMTNYIKFPLINSFGRRGQYFFTFHVEFVQRLKSFVCYVI